ncbi:FimB/Mfa2 family fimbrial subunit [Segatella paludivivens]|uniref:FimB/Mfa2 family fimbrial subunit n=1 Tax=Segatella paludivivens TaxID=185294 RepID=UPI0003AAD8F6|nr:FimB/Mfa2 family fimbrial subunit [Segatella paludivivens]
MKIRHILITCILLAMLSPLISSCINDDESLRVQYNVGVRLTTRTGEVLPDSVAGSVHAYMFIGGRYSNEVAREPDGRYYLCFDNRQTMRLVAVGLGSSDSVQLVPPVLGDSLSSVCARLRRLGDSRSATRAADAITEITPMSYICYGSFSYTPGDALRDSSFATLTMMNKNVRIHIVIRNLLSQMGAGNYTVKLQGFRSALAFDGSIKGDSVVYEPHGGFNSDGVFSTDIINALPTANGENVTFTLYKNDNPIFKSTTDSSGIPITLSPEDDKAIVVDVGKMGVNINVMPWSDVNNGTIFY